MKNDLGLTDEEEKIMNSLVNAWNRFVRLHANKDNVDDFRRAIHDCQRILGMRALARKYKGWNQP